MVSFPHLLEGLARTVSIRRTKSSGDDAGTKQPSRNSKPTKLVSVCSKTGNKGMNQDSFTVLEDYSFQEDMMFCGVFDGHGPWGHLIARRVRQLLPSALVCYWQQQQTLPLLGSPGWFDIWKQSYLNTYAGVDLELKHNRRIDSYRSGTTALTVVKQGNHLIIANIGDSRAVLGTTSDDGSLLSVQLTVDLKPNLPQEAERIKQSKGKVFSLPDEPDVYRLWNPNGETGFAVSRAFGDYCVKEFGLISVPDVTHWEITSRDRFVILATDGVWDVIPNKDAVNIVGSAPDWEKSAKRLVECAAREWKRKKPGCAMDDISAVCMFFAGTQAQAVNYSLKAAKEIDP